MQGNQPTLFSKTEHALIRALDYHMTRYNCFGCLQCIDSRVNNNTAETKFHCKQCDAVIYVDQEYETPNS